MRCALKHEWAEHPFGRGWNEGGNEGIREAGAPLDSSEEGRNENGVEGVVCDAAELVAFGVVSPLCGIVSSRAYRTNLQPWWMR